MIRSKEIISRLNDIKTNDKELETIYTKNIVLIDSKDGSRWSLFIEKGELKIEPIDLNKVRDYKINKLGL